MTRYDLLSVLLDNGGEMEQSQLLNKFPDAQVTAEGFSKCSWMTAASNAAKNRGQLSPSHSKAKPFTHSLIRKRKTTTRNAPTFEP